MAGVLVRTGQTEGSIDLCRLAGLTPAACIIEIMRDDGEMARVPDLAEFAKRHNLKMCSVAQIIEHRLKRESLVKRLEPIAGSVMRTGGTGGGGEWRVYAYESLVDPLPHVVLTHGLGETLHAGREVEVPTLVRVHRANVLGDVFQDVDSGPAAPTGLTLRHSMEAIEREGRGAIIYLRHETPGDDLAARLMRVRHGGGSTPNSGADAPALSHRDGIASNAMPMQERLVGIGSQILRDLGLTKLRLLTSSPKPGPASLAWPGLDGFGIEIVDQVEICHR
jgi:3,4-dihydroxy 2-butanone 4-phosphate synthase/GTP cyclohydrolase II